MTLNLQEASEFIDAAKRISDTISLHVLVTSDLMENVGRWCAFKLQDGTSDGETYPTKDDAMRLQKGDPKLYCYIKIPPDGMPLNHAATYLRICRHPMIDNTAPEHVISPAIFQRFSNLTTEQKRDLARRAIEAKKNGNSTP